MAIPLTDERTPARRPVAGAAGVSLSFLVALLLWLCIGGVIDYYVASTARDRFRDAVRTGDLSAACIHASTAAAAFDILRNRHAYQKWKRLKDGYCGRG